MSWNSTRRTAMPNRYAPSRSRSSAPAAASASGPAGRQEVEQRAVGHDLAHRRFRERPQGRIAIGDGEGESLERAGLRCDPSVYSRVADSSTYRPSPVSSSPSSSIGSPAHPAMAGLPARVVRAGPARGAEPDLESSHPIGGEDRDPLDRTRPAKMQARARARPAYRPNRRKTPTSPGPIAVQPLVAIARPAG